MSKDWIRYALWVICATIWATICFVVPDFIDNPISSWKAFISILAYIISVGIFHLLIIYLIGSQRVLCSILLPLYALLGSVCAYYRLIYHVSITPLLVDAALHTHVREAAGVVSIWLIVWVLFNIGISIYLCYFRWHKINNNISIWHWLIVLALTIGYYAAIPRLKTALETRYPLNIVISISKCITEINRTPVERTFPTTVSNESPDSLVVVVVIGEAARADHMQLNGYEKATNPKLSERKNVVSLPNIYSQYTYTNGSVPHIMTRADSVNTEYAYNEHSFVALYENAGFNTIWLTNKNQVQPFIDFMNEADTTLYTTGALTQALYAKWLDGDLLPLMDNFLCTDSKQLYILHTMGSHWLYDTHVSDELCVFQPVVTNRDIRHNTLEQIVNSYDNTIVYLDDFIDSIIYRLNDQCAIILYISDHGESLGEGGRFLHAQENAEEEKYPAALVWYSDKYETLYPDKIRALHNNKDKRYRTDFVFYSILYAAGIVVEGDNKQVNILQ